MITLSEQHGYKKPKPIADIEKYTAILKKQNYNKSIQRGENKAYCFNITHNENEVNPYHIETTYFVGVDWIVENELSIYIEPKLNNGKSEVDYVKMLFDILKEPENYNHLDQLCEINFEKPTIAIKQKQDLLTPLLLVQYIHILKKIVQKGLKKSYYSVTKNLNSRVKGKILVNETIKKNHFNNKMLYNYCQYTEFGINSMENKVLKKALTFSIAAIQNLKGVETSQISGLLNYIQPAFANVDNDVNIDELKTIKTNKLYKEYGQALKFAKHILKRYGYNISAANSTTVSVPPFWVDMSKLFELYVFSKLKEKFTLHHEVTYHKTFNYLEPDFIIKTQDGTCKMVVDAKYKPQYQDGNISTEDIRQISGYARLKKVYEFLELEKDKVIDCLVIYSNQGANRKDFINSNFKSEEDKNYVNFYKIGIELPNQSTL
ncbi:5-methylcytosine restriction system specificity protein McrC [Emticicia sp. SJ17W-69]|uniref:5-methylcytosine restriction system specificity protein McrC n=1 Tax=Emticicia sp. SJ17W-69 TaxID=3421657 RepID=UPI003EB79108